MGGIWWQVVPVPPYSVELIDRTGVLTVATTDPLEHRIYIANNLSYDFTVKVFIHELGHAAMVSFGLLEDVRRMVKPEYIIEMEEWICNLIADHGNAIYQAAYATMGYDALHVVPREIERMIA